LTARAPELHDVQISQLCPMGKVPYAAPELARSFRLTTPFIIGPEIREAVAAGQADFMPVFLSEMPRLFGDRYQVDWALVQLTPPDRDGFARPVFRSTRPWARCAMPATSWPKSTSHAANPRRRGGSYRSARCDHRGRSSAL
jgi:hypothetical protein